MGTEKFILFFSMILILLLIIDIYFLKSWQNFTKVHNWSKLAYKIPWVMGIVIFVFYALSLWLRLENRIPTQIEKFFFSAASIWYLPKLLIVPIIFVKDTIKFINRLINKRKYVQPNPDFGNNSSIDIDNRRRKLFKNVGWAMAGVPFIWVTRGVIETTHDFKVHEVEIPLHKLGANLSGFKIVQLSDIHAGSFISPEPVSKVRRIIEQLNPDLIVMTGDFVNFHPNELNHISSELSKLKAKYGVYGCLGNHDHYMNDNEHNSLKEKLSYTGMKLLINDNTQIKIENSTIQMIGLDNVNFKTDYSDFPKAMSGIDSNIPSILLCHDPTNWDRFVRKKLDIDLMLSGHTHGGQVGIELFGQYLSPVRIVYKQWAGLYKDNEQYLYINRGLGVVGPPVRVDMPPEITLIKLVSNSRTA